MHCGPGPNAHRQSQPSDNLSGKEDFWKYAAQLGRCLLTQRTEPLRVLARGPLRVTDLAEEMALDIRSVSYHLELLRKLGFVECERHGTARIYRLTSRTRVERIANTIALTFERPDFPILTLTVPDTETNVSPRDRTQNSDQVISEATLPLRDDLGDASVVIKVLPRNTSPEKCVAAKDRSR